MAARYGSAAPYSDFHAQRLLFAQPLRARTRCHRAARPGDGRHGFHGTSFDRGQPVASAVPPSGVGKEPRRGRCRTRCARVRRRVHAERGGGGCERGEGAQGPSHRGCRGRKSPRCRPCGGSRARPPGGQLPDHGIERRTLQRPFGPLYRRRGVRQLPLLPAQSRPGPCGHRGHSAGAGETAGRRHGRRAGHLVRGADGDRGAPAEPAPRGDHEYRRRFGSSLLRHPVGRWTGCVRGRAPGGRHTGTRAIGGGQHTAFRARLRVRRPGGSAFGA